MVRSVVRIHPELWRGVLELDAESTPRAVGSTRREVALVAGAGLATAALFLLVRDSLVDDAYITLSYAKNLAQHLHWGLIPHEVATSATSPLNVVLLAGAAGAFRIGSGHADAVWAAGGAPAALAMRVA